MSLATQNQNLSEDVPFVLGPVASAGAVPLSRSSSGQPVMAEAILDWFRPMTIGVVTSQIQDGTDPSMDGVAKQVVRYQITNGCVQPGKATKMDIQAGGQRSWQSCVMHTTPDFNLDTDSVILIEDTRYRVMEVRDFSVNGYLRYELLEDYERAH